MLWRETCGLVVVRKNGAVAGKTLSLFADDANLPGWCYGVMLTDLSITALALWHLYRGRVGCEKRIKKADFGLGSFVLGDFWATEAALGVTMLAYLRDGVQGLHEAVNLISFNLTEVFVIHRATSTCRSGSLEC
jgi:hypothetical protein